jgi:hypothetical protein
MKTSELQGAALDWAVAKCEGEETFMHKGQLNTRWSANGYSPSTNWAQGGPIIEREGMALHPAGKDWSSDIDRCYQQYGPTPLIAAMRCYVASKLGDEVEIPEEV